MRSTAQETQTKSYNNPFEILGILVFSLEGKGETGVVRLGNAAKFRTVSHVAQSIPYLVTPGK